MKRFKYYLSAQITMVISILLTTAYFSQVALAACNECGTVTDVKIIKIEGQGSGVGAVTGGVLGGVVGHQVGGGRGKDLATIGGLLAALMSAIRLRKNQNLEPDITSM